VSSEYIQHYQSRAQAVIQYPKFRHILAPKISSKLFALLLDDRPGFRRRLIGFAVLHLLLTLRSRPSLGRYYLNVGHTGLDHPGHLDWVQKSGVRPVYFIHDLIPITHPQFCRDGEKQRHVSRMTNALRAAHAIIGNSQDTLDILSEFAAVSALPMPVSIFAHLGTAKAPAHTPAPSPMAKPYFVILSTIEGRKNHALLLDIWASMIASGAENIPQLVIIGQRGWQCEDVTIRLDNDAALKPYITELSQCDDATLAQYLRGAKALLFPSFAEGYGMPLMEALLIGTPVIASDILVFHEIAGDVPDFLKPSDQNGWLNMILLYSAHPSPLRENQLRRMEKLKLPSWPDHFNKIDAWLSSLPA
jgi:glycosyltransferase involved in cell wall biosynthesis